MFDVEYIKNVAQKIKELNGIYSELEGLNIKSTVNYSDFPDDETWTYIYKYDDEQKFKVNHNGEHFYMSEEDMWNVLENAIEVEKDEDKKHYRKEG